MNARLGDAGSVLGSVGAALTSAAASICCIGPLGIALLGVEGAILAASVKPYRAWLLGGSLAMLALAHWSVRRRRGREGASCPTCTGRWVAVALWAATALWVAAVAIQFAADRYWI